MTSAIRQASVMTFIPYHSKTTVVEKKMQQGNQFPQGFVLQVNVSLLTYIHKQSLNPLCRQLATLQYSMHFELITHKVIDS